MSELAEYGVKMLIGALYMAVFAVLLIGYVWDFFRIKKSVVIV